jgi:Flp pilus assembly protein TadG
MSLAASIKCLRRFQRDESGNFAMLFGLSIVPLLGLTGAAVDYSRASKARAELSAAIDSAALMAARDASKLTDAELTTRINNWIKNNLSPETAARFGTASIAIDRVNRTVNIGGAIDVDTSIARVLGQNTIAVSSNNQSSWGTKKIELALALDNTGSMAGAKIAALQTATRDLLKIMQDAVTEPDQVKVSMVPFHTQVRMPTSYKDANWLRWDVPKKGTTNQFPQKSSWTGCISDRDSPYDASDAAVNNGVNATKYPAAVCQYNLATSIPLTNDWTALNAAVGTMIASGNTNVTMGVAWGWASLSEGLPLPEGRAANTPRLTKYMIVLTDGDNTENRFTTNGNTIDGRTALACTNAKAAGIQIYTIRVINGDANLLRNCASSPSMYYDVQNASQLSPVFKKIAAEIASVRLTM